ncbi:MAG: aminotransferase class V-fold PLP-dependent enzyme [Acidobacteria bacterium]|nr:aminotransferase class V-fold PLP-dependent enzyme [Acidobacteriota bacterium]
MNSRRRFLGSASAVLAAAASAGEASEQEFTRWYEVDRGVTNLENAYWGIMARQVMEEYARKVAYVNRRNSPFVRGMIPGESLREELPKVRARVARLVNVATEEIALTRCGTESLQDLIIGYNRLKPGDRVIFGDLDYDAMQNAMLFLKDRRGVEVTTFTMPEPATTANILAAYEEVLKATPRARLLLVTHLCHRTGLVNPVKEIIALARRHGVASILDTAQAVGQMPVDLEDIGADFAGFSLHKWIGAPLGTGAVYIRKSKLAEMDLCLGNREDAPDDVRSRTYPGTYDFAAVLTIPAAIDFHNRLTVERKRARLQELRNYWVSRVRELDGVEILTPDDPARYGATTSFRLKALKTFEQAVQLQNLLMSKYGIVTVARKGIARGAAIRVTPALYNTAAELDRFVAAVRAEYRLFA